MKWVTREKARVDRIACPWLVKRFVDKDAQFLFVPAAQVLDTARMEGAISFDSPGAELNHFKEEGEERVSFDAILKRYNLHDKALLELARIVRGADARIRMSPPESAGLEAAAIGFRAMAKDDVENQRLQFPLYDALFRYCQLKVEGQAKLEHSAPAAEG